MMLMGFEEALVSLRQELLQIRLFCRGIAVAVYLKDSGAVRMLE